VPVTFKSTGLTLGRKLQRLSDDGKNVARAAIKKEVENLIEEGFEKREEPRGRYWEPRKKNYPWPILEKTGRMRGAFTVTTTGPNIIVENSASERGREYALFHQYGWMQGGEKQAARQVMPVKSMSTNWANRVDAVVRLALQALK
jgi:phage gpG-like protein